MGAFAIIEVLALLAIPMLGYVGYQALLDSNQGEFVEGATASDAGYRAFVDPSPVMVVASTAADGSVVNLAVLTRASVDAVGGGVMVVEPDVVIDGQRLRDVGPQQAAELLAAGLRLDLGPVETLDPARWVAVAGDQSWQMDNPDPITTPTATYPVGQVQFGGSDVVALLGTDLEAASADAIAYRQEIVWEAVMAAPALGADPAAEFMAAGSRGRVQVEQLPVVEGAGGQREIDPEAAELLVNAMVPYPRGAVEGDRTAVTVLAPAGDDALARTQSAAALFGSHGFEIIQIGSSDPAQSNAAVLAPAADWPGVVELTELLGGATVVTVAGATDVTVNLGPSDGSVAVTGSSESSDGAAADNTIDDGDEQ